MQRKDMSIKMLASRSGISVNTLNMYIGYREAMPSADVAVRLARVLGVTVEYLVDGAASSHARMAELAADSGAGEKAPLSAFVLIVDEIKKTPKENLPALLELVIKFNAEHGETSR